MHPWIYLSPHFDDIALSCGGLVWEQSRTDAQVEVWSICACAPPPGQPYSPFAESLHARWASGPAPVSVRQAEDIASCQAMGAQWQHFPLADCIYRTNRAGQHLYASEDALFGSLHPDEEELCSWLAEAFRRALPSQAQVVCPLTLGHHVDHQLVRRAAEQLSVPLLYYADYPYALQEPQTLAALRQSGWQARHFPVGQPGLTAWQAAVAAHATQISTFWPSQQAMQAAITAYWQAENCGVHLWRKG